MHYYQHNIGDYARDTGHLSVLEHGVYRLLLDWCYLNEKPITTDQAIRVSRGNPAETQSVLSEFFLLNSDGWTHKRVTQEIGAYHDKAQRNRVNGAKGGRPKPKNNPVGYQVGSEINPNQEPITNNHKPIYKEKSASAQSDYADLIINVSPDIFLAWKKLRKEKKAAITRIVINGYIREAGKAGWTLEQAMQKSVERGWTGFEADWVADKGGGGKHASMNKQQELEASNAAIAAKFIKENGYAAQ
jgi:uncharacterized protein YdaU (DUF1376 family)